MSGVAEVSPKYLAEAVSNAAPFGYKQTDVGVIPDHWGVTRLRDLLKEPPKYGINAPAVPLEGTLPVYIRITDISEDGYFKPSEKVGVRSPLSGLYKLADGDVVLARTGASVGKSYLYKEDDGVLVYAGFLIKVSPDKKKLEPRFLSQYLKTQRYWSWVTVNSMRSGQPGINGNEYSDLLIPLPKIQEQTVIANALSDVDALISELEKLIAKKQAIKTATMQQLLTGRTRLLPFAFREDGSPKGIKPSELGEIPEDWEVVNIGDLGQVDPENLGSTTSPDYEFSYVSLEQIEKGVLVGTARTIFRNAPSRARRVLKKGDILVSTVRPNLMSHYFVQHEVNDLICSTGFSVIRFFKEKLCPGYLYQHLFSSVINNQIEMLVSGSNYPAINSGDVKQLKVQIGSVEEQTAIATILSDMDAEIQALEQRLGKTRHIKQGMMQELLTGKTRLIQGSEVR